MLFILTVINSVWCQSGAVDDVEKTFLDVIGLSCDKHSAKLFKVVSPCNSQFNHLSFSTTQAPPAFVAGPAKKKKNREFISFFVAICINYLHEARFHPAREKLEMARFSKSGRHACERKQFVHFSLWNDHENIYTTPIHEYTNLAGGRIQDSKRGAWRRKISEFLRCRKWYLEHFGVVLSEVLEPMLGYYFD